MKAKYLQKPMFPGGHSSGGGTILNYSSFNKREKVRGYVFISPHLGFRSKTEIENPANPFATVKTDLFVQNAMFGTHACFSAVNGRFGLTIWSAFGIGLSIGESLLGIAISSVAAKHIVAHQGALQNLKF